MIQKAVIIDAGAISEVLISQELTRIAVIFTASLKAKRCKATT